MKHRNRGLRIMSKRIVEHHPAKGLRVHAAWIVVIVRARKHNTAVMEFSCHLKGALHGIPQRMQWRADNFWSTKNKRCVISCKAQSAELC
jgi:hypothetical protein